MSPPDENDFMHTAVAGRCVDRRRERRLDNDGCCGRCAKRRRQPDPPPPPCATQHTPGTLGKLLAMEWRRERGFSLWHAGDATEDERGNLPSRYSGRSYEDPEPRIVRLLVRSA
jgi:hypothetical protein